MGADELRARARKTWASGDWESFSRLIGTIGPTVLDRAGATPGERLLDVGTGNGMNVAIPAAQRGLQVVGLDVTPELLEHARRHAAEAGVAVEWVEGDAAELPFEAASFDRVISTFGAMFAPNHARAAAELVRVCRPGGTIAMTTWADDGFVGEMFALNDAFLPTPPPGVGTPPQWGSVAHVEEMFAAAGVEVATERETVVFSFPSLADALERYATDFGPFVMARAALEPQGKWDAFLDAFADQLRRYSGGGEGPLEISSVYLLNIVQR